MKYCVIVDAYRFSKDYIYYCKRKSIACLHVQSTRSPIPELANSSTYREEDYTASFIDDHSFDSLLDQLKIYPIDAVIAGMESGVTLADRIAHAFNLKKNDMKHHHARRNKYEMANALKKAHLPCMKYQRVHSTKEAISWLHANTNYPVVIKPLASAGTENVFICQSEADLIRNFAKIIDRKNCLGLVNDSVLIQEYLVGTEYMINAVSAHGHHYFTDLWRCTKKYVKGHGMIYDREELIASTGHIQDQIKSYVTAVLNTLGIQFGASHTELIYTQQGPILIEVGARVGGNVNCKAHSLCLGVNQLELTIDAYLDEASFKEKTKKPYPLLKQAITILLSTENEGVIEHIPLIQTIENCKSLYWYHLNVKIRDTLKPTRDLFSAPGKVILVDDNLKTITNDYHSLLQGMKNGFITAGRVI